MKDKSSEILTILVFLLFSVFSLFLVVFFIKRSMNTTKKNSSHNYSENVIVSTTTSTTTKSNMNDEDKNYYNSIFKSYVNPLLASLVVNKDEPNLLANINYNNNMLNDKNFGYSFVLYMLLNDNINKDIDEDNNTLSIDINTFNEYYNNILGESFDINKLESFDEYKYPTGIPLIEGNKLIAKYTNNYKDETYMDIKAVNKIDNNGSITITSDVIVYNTIDEYNKYQDISNYDYPEELIYTKVELTYSNNRLVKMVFRDK